MKKVLFVSLFFAVVAHSITQSSILGNWSLVSAKEAKNTIVSLTNDTLNLTDDWKFSEIALYKIDYPGFGPNKVDLAYKLRVSSKGDYRIEGSGIRKYTSSFESEI